MNEYHNSSIRQGRSPERAITTRVAARKSKQGSNCSVFNDPLQLHGGGVFIAQQFTYSLAKIPLLPLNCQHLGIFPGQNRNITTLDTN